MRFLTILKIKLIDLLQLRLLLVILLVTPVLLGLIAGTANLKNMHTDVQAALVDQDQSPQSARLIESLKELGWTILNVSPEQAERLLLRNRVDGILTVEQGYGENLATLEDVKLTYRQAEGSLLTTVVEEGLAAAVLPAYSRLTNLKMARDSYAEMDLVAPANLDALFDRQVELHLDGNAAIRIDYISDVEIRPTLTFVVSDYSMEVFFLSIYAVLGVMTISQASLRRRLASTGSGLALDYAASIIALMILGLVQILAYTLTMQLLMQSPLRLTEVLLLLDYLLLMLGLGQLLSLIEQSLRLYLSLLVLLLLSVLGGCFFQLSEKILSSIGQYTPMGWVLHTIKGYDTLPFYLPALLAIVLLSAGYWVQKMRAVQ